MSYEASYNRSRHGKFACYDYGTGFHWKSAIGVAAISINGSDISGGKSFSLHEAPNWRRLVTAETLKLETTDYQSRNPEEHLIVLVTD